MRSHSIGYITPSGMLLQVVYRFIEPTFRHRVRLVDPQANEVAAWDGIVGGESTNWPASPPIQELSQELIGGRDCLLGVGRAGKCHWSLSVESLPAEASEQQTRRIEGTDYQAGQGLVFDIACRSPGPTGWLGSTYRAESEGPIRIAPSSAGDASEVIWCGTKMLRIEPEVLPERWPGTVRWRYTLMAD